MWFEVLVSSLFALLIAATVIVIIDDDGDSSAKTAWLLIIAVLPVLGFLLYLLFGINQRHHWVFRHRHKRFTDLLVKEEEEEGVLGRMVFSDESLSGIPEKYRPLSRLLSRDSRMQPSDDNDFEIITTGQRKYDLLMEDLRNAKESIHMEYFHFGNDRGSQDIRDMLLLKAREGVKVRFINENVANFPISSRYYDGMKEAGVEVVKFTNPRKHTLNLITRLNYRNHRKIVVIDGRIAYTGGMNINDHYFLLWRDTHLRITGKAVASLQYIFLDSWVTSGGTLDRPLAEFFPDPVPKVDTPASCGEGEWPVLRNKTVQVVADEPDAPLPVNQMSYVWAIMNAKEYIYVQTPYFAPPQQILDALKSAAASGVDVRVMLPKNVDTLIMRPANRSYYRESLEAGIRLFERQGEFIHSKTFVMDDDLSCIGSTNLDMRSFTSNYEDNVFVFDKEVALQCKAIFAKDQEICAEITVADIDKWPWYRRFFQKIVRLFSPLL